MNTLKPDFIPVNEPLLLGMHRAEIKKKFDEIVAFVEIEKCFHRAIYAFIMRYCYLGFVQ